MEPSTGLMRMLMFKKNPSKLLLGFTLIELLVTSGLTLVLAGGALAAYNNFHTRQGQVQAARNVMAQVERAKVQSQVGDKPSGTCVSLDGYRVRMVQNTAVYTVAIRCDGNNTDLDAQQLTLPSGYLFRSSVDVLFPPLPSDVAGSDQVVDIGRPNTTQVYRFVIRTNGAIEDQGMVTP